MRFTVSPAQAGAQVGGPENAANSEFFANRTTPKKNLDPGLRRDDKKRATAP